MKCEHHEELIKKIEKLEEKDEKKEVRITKLERNSDVNDEKFNNIMSILGELKVSIDNIAAALSEAQKRPIKLLYQVAGGLILLGLGVAIGWR